MTILTAFGNPLGVAVGQWVRRLTASRFLRNVAIVAGGTAAAQIITVAFSPIITRLYGPEAFGILGIFMAALAILSPLSSLTYGFAVVLPPSDGEARALMKLSFLIGLAVAALSALVFGGFHRQIADAIGFTTASGFLLLAPPVLLLSAMAEPLRQWLVRKKRFRAISRIAIIEAAAAGTSKTAVGLIVAAAPVLLVLQVLAGAFRTVLLWLSARPTLFVRDATDVEPPGHAALKDVAWRYRDFPFFRAPQFWVHAVCEGLPALMLAAVFGPAAAGFYAIARRVLGLPASLISGAVGTVFLPRIAEASHRSERLRPLILKGTAGLALVGLLPFGTVIAFGPTLFGLVFGAEWVTAGEYARWLAIVLYFRFIEVPSNQAVPLLGLQGQFLAYEVVAVTLRVACLSFGIFALHSAVVAMLLFSISGAIVCGVFIAWVILVGATRSRPEIRQTLDWKAP